MDLPTHLSAKRLIDPMITAYRTEYDLNVISLVINWIFGDNDNFNAQDAGVLPPLIRRFSENRDSDQEIEVWGDGPH